MKSPIVEFRNAEIKQGTRTILSGVDLTIHPGEFVYLIGKTGSGKSSLLKTAYAALPLAGGEGTVAGFDLTRLRRRKLPKLRRKLGIVFQDLNLLTDRSVEDNLHFVLRATGWRKRAERDRRIIEVLHLVGLPLALKEMPYALSGGEQQRVAFARALLNKPELLIADEVTGNLDPDTSREMLTLLRRTSDETGAAILFATHDYHLRESFSAKTLRCADGRLIPQPASEPQT